jgi:type IV pilus assembly protein PilQ
VNLLKTRIHKEVKMAGEFRIFILFLILCLFPLKLPAEDYSSMIDPKITISMDFQDAGLKDVVKVLSIQSGLNFIASESVQDRTITLYLDQVPIKEAMDKIFAANNLTYDLDAAAKIFIVKDWGKPEIEKVTKIFYLKHSTVSTSSLKSEMSSSLGSDSSSSGSDSGDDDGKWAAEGRAGITEAVKNNLSEHGMVIEDYRTNSLIITDIPSRMPVIEKIIASLDIPIPQIMLEVEMLDVSKNTADQLGFDFSNNPFTFVYNTAKGQKGKVFFGDMALRGASIPGAAGAVILGQTYAETLDFMRTRTDTKFLARPRLLTLNNETAEIKIATNESIGVSTTTEASSGTTSASPERSETGVLLRITPQVNMDTGEITMFIYPEVSEATSGNAITSGGTTFQFRDPEVRSTKSMVRVNDNQTVLIGGLIRNEFNEIVKKVPILGDIPIIGMLFRHKGGTATNPSKDKQRELIVFITPHIIKDQYTELGAAHKTALLTKDQIGIIPSERRLAIEASLNSFEGMR